MSNYISPQKKQECIDYALAHPEISTSKLATALANALCVIHKPT
jgi:hypothetical protein